MAQNVTEFIERVVPRLQENGVYKTEYHGSTLRDNYGLREHF